jgi:serine/threonine-protein kinase
VSPSACVERATETTMADTSLIGTTLAGRFRISGVIGEGGMATVYRGVQDKEPKQVAIKIMNPELAKETRFVKRFRREAKAAAMLKHPNMVSILEFGVDQGLVYLAMELLEGYDLAMLLHREQKVPELRAIQIAIQVCRALSAAHEQNIVHRDLKPDNIMLIRLPAGVPLPIPGMSPTDFVKVLDFGIAKILDADEAAPIDPRADPASSQFTSERTALTRVGTIVGTPAYMAPEQGRAEQVDPRTDLYAVGVLIYELVTGRVPFTGETPMQVVMRHVNEPPRPPSDFHKIRPELEKIIMRALAKWPAQRQQSAEEMAFELLALLPLYAPPAPPPQPKLALDPSRTLVMEVDEPRKSPGPVPAPAPSPAGRAAAPAPVVEPPAFPTLNIEVPDDIFPMAPKPAAPAPAAAKAAAPEPRSAAAGSPAPSRDVHPHQATLTSPVDPTSRAAPIKRAAAAPAVEVARSQPAATPAVSLSQTLSSEPPMGDDDDDDVPTRMKSPEEAQAAIAAKAAAAPPLASAPKPASSPATKPAAAPSPAKAAAAKPPTGFESTLALDDLPPVPPPAEPAAHPDGGLGSTAVSAPGGSAGGSTAVSAPGGAAGGSTAGAAAGGAATAAGGSSAGPAGAAATSSTPPAAGSDGPVRRPTSELIPITLGGEDDPSAPRASLPQIDVSTEPSAPPAPVAMWQPKPKRMSGTAALVMGIVIGAILFGAILVVVLRLKP